MPSPHNKLGGPLVLMILDGFGERPAADDNAVTRARMPRWNELRHRYPFATIGTSGPDVGLPSGQMGNSEVGHLNLGAGRVAQMDISRIDCAVADRALLSNPAIAKAIDAAKSSGGRLHLLGLVSDGGVHSSLEHLVALIEGAGVARVPVVVHAFLDGRDTPPRSARGFLDVVLSALAQTGGTIGTISGRYFAMDRDKRWERVERAYRAIVSGHGVRFPSATAALEDAYVGGQDDEFVEPRTLGDYTGTRPGDSAIFFNFRPDRARELTEALTSQTFTDFSRAIPFLPPFAPLVCMTQYDRSLALPVAFTKESYVDTFPELLARAHMKQLRCAETEKYAHVTYFFSGGQEKPFDGEDRILVPSPKDVATYDLRPAMSAFEVADAVAKAIANNDYDFVLVNFANPDMVGHTGVLPAAIEALEAVDKAVGVIVDATLARAGCLVITADHGNCEQMIDPKTGAPFTAHTTNRVPLVYVRPGAEDQHLRADGKLADIAPTLLKILGLPQPSAMTGVSLIAR